MTTTVEEPPVAPEPEREPDLGEKRPRARQAAGLAVSAVVALVVLIAAFAVVRARALLRDTDANRFVLVGVAIVVGVGGVFFLYWAMNRAVDWLPEHGGGGPSLRLRRPGPGDPRRVPRLSGDQHYLSASAVASRARASWASTTTSSCSPTTACAGPSATPWAGS